MRYEVFWRLTKIFVKISALCVWIFLFASCSETVLNPEEGTDDSPVLGQPEPITFFNTIGEGDLQFDITSKVYYSPSFDYNVVAVHFTNSEDTYGGTIALTPMYPTDYDITINIGQKKLILKQITMIPAYANVPGALYIRGTYYSKSDELPFYLKVGSWYVDGHQ